MKKLSILFLLFFPVLFFVSCSSDKGGVEIVEGKGHLILKSSFNHIRDKVVNTRASDIVQPDYTELELLINGVPTSWPSDGIIYNVEPGSYTIIVRTDGGDIPNDFDSPYFYGEYKTEVVAGARTYAEIKLDLLNSAIRFDYSGLAGTDYENIMAMVAHVNRDEVLIYDEANRLKPCFFDSSEEDYEVEIFFIDESKDDDNVPIGGKESLVLPWNKLNYDLTIKFTIAPDSGDVYFDIDYEIIEEDEMTIELGASEAVHRVI